MSNNILGISDDSLLAWLKTFLILLPIFIIGFGFGGFYHEDGGSGWSLMGTIEFGKMVAESVAGNIVFWGIMIFLGRLICLFWKIFG